jgi:NTP pyrophosphatase (non-canonical NTP hydrolase)
MDLDDYQCLARGTATYTDTVPPREQFFYAVLGLCGESGEVADKIKKILRDHRGDFANTDLLHDLKLELGDVLWYLAALCTELGFELGDVARCNLDKLASRAERNTLQGSGDHR